MLVWSFIVVASRHENSVSSLMEFWLRVDWGLHLYRHGNVFNIKPNSELNNLVFLWCIWWRLVCHIHAMDLFSKIHISFPSFLNGTQVSMVVVYEMAIVTCMKVLISVFIQCFFLFWPMLLLMSVKIKEMYYCSIATHCKHWVHPVLLITIEMTWQWNYRLWTFWRQQALFIYSIEGTSTKKMSCP